MLQLPDMRIPDNRDTQLVLGAAACVGVIGVMVRAYLRKSDSGLPLPPSPPTWRLRGHLLPAYNTSLTVARWIDEYGPVITIRSGTQNIVIIGRHKAAVDIMEKQGGLLADRPRRAAAEILTHGLVVGLSSAGDRLRRKRRALHTHLQSKAAEAYEPLQMSHAKNLVLNILDDPCNFQNHAATCSAATIMKVAYGKTTSTSASDPEIREARQLIKRIRFVMHPGAYLVDLIPWLKYLPWYAPELKDEFERTKRLYTDQLNRVRQQMQGNVDIGPSFAKHMLEKEQLYGLTETEMAYVAGALFGAGTEMTAMAICTVLMAAAHFPEEQAKVQEELDVVIGRKRGTKLYFSSQLCQLNDFPAEAPTFADKQSLPHLEAFIIEALRWRPLDGLPHRTTADVIWENYCIPVGTTVIGNIWAISRDPEVFPEPNAFKPQRWINEQGRVRDDLTFFVYGFGRRVCPGLHLANRSLFINLLLMLWAFQISLDPTKPQDDMGFMNEAMPNVPCALEFKTRVPEVELRYMMED
ncbi:cytochrome P450 [Suillus clintonianus]|uniref:cytochrome P450 n=1 Tax=Suillus clintonianus TaxID=1904413 RepID=UPI001B87BDA1|nr:cytochrome P450 [Suillus clintonianus]KAG2133740.1 cytochrome P450 [Suillus clintonianus]